MWTGLPEGGGPSRLQSLGLWAPGRLEGPARLPPSDSEARVASTSQHPVPRGRGLSEAHSARCHRVLL